MNAVNPVMRRKYLFLCHTNKVPNRTLTMIEHFKRENEVLLINLQRNPLQENNFSNIPHINIKANWNVKGLYFFYKRVRSLIRNIDFDLGYCGSIRLVPVLLALGRGRRMALVYDSIEMPSLVASNKIISHLKFLPVRFVQAIFEIGESLLVRMVNGALVIDSKDQILLNRFRKVQPNCQCIMNFPSKKAEPDQESVDHFRMQFKDRKVIVYAGSIFKAKGLYRYLDLAYKLKQDEPSILLVIVGILRMDEDLSEIVQYVKRYGLSDHVLFMPWMSFSKLLALLQCAMVGLSFQKPDFFYFRYVSVGNSRKPFTYMLAGVPVVVSLPVLGHFVEEKGVGRYADYHDHDAIYKTVREILTNDALHSEMGRKGKQLIENECNWENELSKAECVFIRAIKDMESRKINPWKR